ncbi:hypothetical protein DDD_0874 [Nonlabens dokdonensis DSW-6]|uniref:Uncharacterized protein n=1 Tax=Nonlabens dokdonensis (strain DSM 17205 / KCTC 12402 / DSW-6) TaxID=592029 RepID=L7W728_NONDD|nr:hypothetical protein DDD_0874 [Nonlabens dokdonensis DSW-6]
MPFCLFLFRFRESGFMKLISRIYFLIIDYTIARISSSRMMR